MSIYVYSELFKSINRPEWLPAYRKENIDKALNLAVDFIEGKYMRSIRPLFVDGRLVVKFSRRGSFAKITFNDNDTYVIRVVATKVWHTYKLQTVGLYSDGITCSEVESFTFQFVHELTHLIQKMTDKRLSEVETTRNEILYAFRYLPQLHQQLMKIEEDASS